MTHVESRIFDDPAAVVRAALEALDRRLEDEAKLADLRREVARGVTSSEAGRSKPLTPELIEDIKQRVRRRAEGTA